MYVCSDMRMNGWIAAAVVATLTQHSIYTEAKTGNVENWLLIEFSILQD